MHPAIPRSVRYFLLCAPLLMAACSGAANNQQVHNLQATVTALQAQLTLQATPTRTATPSSTPSPTATPAATPLPTAAAGAAKAPSSAQPAAGAAAASGGLAASEPLLIQTPVNGVGDGASQSLHLYAGFAVFALRYDNRRTFTARLLDSGGKEVAGLVNIAGSYRGRTAAIIPADGDYVLAVHASGPWRGNILQPRVADAKGTTSAQGYGDDVRYLQLIAGPRRFTISHSGSGAFTAYLYSDTGRTVLVDANGPYYGTVTQTIAGGGGNFAVVVQADGYWTVSVQ